MLQLQLQLHHRDRYRAEAFVGHAHDRGGAHVGMGLERLLHFAWVDLETATDDGIVGTSVDEHEPVLVDGGEVVGQCPRVVGHRRCSHRQQSNTLLDDGGAVLRVDEAQRNTTM